MVIHFILSALFYFLSACCKGVMDTLMFHYSTSVFVDRNPLFWNPGESWRNKYKNGDPKQGPRFPLSTTLLVGFTDGWHLMQMAQLASQRAALVFAASALLPNVATWVWLVAWVALIPVHSVGFHLFYTVLLKKKQLK